MRSRLHENVILPRVTPLSKLKYVRPFDYSLSLSLTSTSVTSWFGITLLCWKCTNHGSEPLPISKSSIRETKPNKQRIIVRITGPTGEYFVNFGCQYAFTVLLPLELWKAAGRIHNIRRISQTSCSLHFLAVFRRFAPCMHLSLLGGKHLKFVNIVFKRFIAGKLAIVWLFMRRGSAFFLR